MIKHVVAAALLASSSIATAAPFLDVYAGVDAAYVTPTGEAGSGGYSASLDGELGYGRSYQPRMFVGVEHPLPLLPNVRLSRSRFSESAVHSLVAGVHAGGSRPAMMMDSRLQITATDLTLYYTPLEWPLKLDVGLNLRHLDVDFMLEVTPEGAPAPLQTIHKSASQVFPALYVGTHAGLPFFDSYVSAQVLYSRYQDRRLEQARVALGWRPMPLLRLELGYRHERQEFSSNAINVDMTTSGPFVSLGLRF